MKLPRLDIPNYVETLPMAGVDVTYRPYTVKEEKILMMGVQSDDAVDKINAVNQIVSNCSDLDVKTAHPVDLEWIFLKIRACSVASMVEVNYNVGQSECGGINSNIECPNVIKTAFDISQVYVANMEELKKFAIQKKDTWIVMLTDELGIQLKFKSIVNEISALYEMTETIIDGSEVYQKSDFSVEEFDEFIDDLPTPVTLGIKQFLELAPTTQVDIKARCPKCKKEFNHTATGVISFLV